MASNLLELLTPQICTWFQALRMSSPLLSMKTLIFSGSAAAVSGLATPLFGCRGGGWGESGDGRRKADEVAVTPKEGCKSEATEQPRMLGEDAFEKRDGLFNIGGCWKARAHVIGIGN